MWGLETVSQKWWDYWDRRGIRQSRGNCADFRLPRSVSMRRRRGVLERPAAEQEVDDISFVRLQ
ncbi:MAG: hypothetical protein ACE5KM_04470, partial [Planctomycetaceae bacterium]